MEKFVIDLDKVLNDFEFNEDRAEQITSVAATAVDASTAEKRTTESTSPKTYNFSSEESIDVMPSFEKHKDTKPVDIDSKYLLTEKNLVSMSGSNKDSINNFYAHDCVSDNKIGQKSCVHTSDSDQISLTIYKDISYNLLQKQQNGNSDLKDGNRYDKKLNQPNFKPSISNVFNSLNEYINAPTGSLDYVEPILNKKDDLTKVSITEEDFILTKDATIDHSTTKEKKMDLTDKNILDYKTVLPELDMFVKIDAEDKQDNTMQSAAPQHFTMIKSETCNPTTIPTSNIAVSRQEHDTIESTELSDKMKRHEDINDALKVEKISTNQVPELTEEEFQEKIKNCSIICHSTNEEAMNNNGRFEAPSENIYKQKQCNLVSQSLVDRYTFIKNKDSIAESTISLNANITNSKNHNENVKTSKVCDISSNVHVNRTTDASNDFSEEELSRYLLELEEEEKCKTKDTSRSDDTWSLKAHDESGDNKAKTANQRHEDINDTLKLEKIRTNQVPELTEEEFQEKIKNCSIICHSMNTCNENVIDVQCDDTLKVALNEKSKQLQNTQTNELDKTIRENDVLKIADQDVIVQESISQALSDIAIEETATLKFEDVEEQYNHNIDVTRNLQKNISTGIRSQDNNDNAVKNLSENKEDCDERLHCQDLTENNKDIPIQHDNRTHDGDKISKTEIIYKIADADCTVSHTNEDNQDADEKLTRPHTLDIVSPHKNDSLESLSVTPGEAEQSGTGGIVDEDRGAASDVSDNSLIECNTVLGKQPPFWVPDSDAPSCMLCDVKFTVLKRRHHCRACGKVLCNKCCNMKFRLEYQGNIDSRVCVSCYDLLTKADSEQGISDWSTEYNSHANCSDVNSSQGRQPNPNNPMEYCSTIPPLQQLAGSLPPPPTVMVPVGVLKREGSKHRTEGQKSVMFSDGIRPGCDLTELDTCWDPKPPYRKQGNKRIFTSGSILTDTATRRQSHPPLDSVTNSYIPHNPNLLPPTVTIHKGQITYHLSMDESVLYKMLQNECEPPVMFAINRNLYAYVKITNLNCCVNKVCWNVTSRGLACVGQDEVILLVEVLSDETRIPKDLLIYINQLYLEAIKGNTMTELGFSIYQGSNLLGSREHTGFLFIRQTLQCLQKIILPPAPFLIGLLIHRWETPWARVFPLRLLLRLGAEYRYYPCPLVSVRFRDALYFEIGHTVMKVLADFRNFGYTLPGVKGLTIHLKNRTTDVMFPKNRYDQVIKGLHNSNDHVLAYASNFSIAADSHLVCIQTNTGDESNYQTQAINIHNRPRTVTGASFIVINGALKSSMGLSAKSSIVEDGLMVEIMPEKMEALKAALKNMQDFSIGCGHQGASEPDETVNIKWVDNDVQFNLGVKSPIDGQLMDGIPSIRVHNGTDYKGATRFIRWTEVFIIKSDDHLSGVNDPVDINKLSGNIAKATCLALVKLLDLLATAGLTKIGVRATIHLDNVGYEAGSEGTKLPPIYMKSLDNELIQVLHKAAQSSQDAHTVLELIFYILED